MPTYNPLSSYGYNTRTISPEQQAVLDAAKQRQLTTLPSLSELTAQRAGVGAPQGYQSGSFNGGGNNAGPGYASNPNGQLGYTPGAADPNDPLIEDPVYGWGTRSQIERLRAQIAGSGNTNYSPPPQYTVPQGTPIKPVDATAPAPSSRSLVPPVAAPPVSTAPPMATDVQQTPWTQPRSKTLAYWQRPQYRR